MSTTIDLKQVMAGVIGVATAALAANPAVPSVNLENKTQVAQQISAAVSADTTLQRAAEAVTQATTSIPWYQSTVMVGNIVSAVSVIGATVYGKAISGDMQQAIVQLVLIGGPLIGTALSLFGRLTSKAQPVTLTAGS